MPADRVLPTQEAAALVSMVRRLASDELASQSVTAEAQEQFPREVFRTLGRLGLLGLPYPVSAGGGGQPFEVYLQVLEELASAWASVAVGVSVHALSCYPLAKYGSEEQRDRWLGELVGGELLGAYCLQRGPGRLRPGGHAHFCAAHAAVGTCSAARRRGRLTAGTPTSTR